MYNVQCFLVIVNSWIVTVRSVHSNVTKILYIFLLLWYNLKVILLVYQFNVINSFGKIYHKRKELKKYVIYDRISK